LCHCEFTRAISLWKA